MTAQVCRAEPEPRWNLYLHDLSAAGGRQRSVCPATCGDGSRNQNWDGDQPELPVFIFATVLLPLSSASRLTAVLLPIGSRLP